VQNIFGSGCGGGGGESAIAAETESKPANIVIIANRTRIALSRPVAVDTEPPRLFTRP